MTEYQDQEQDFSNNKLNYNIKLEDTVEDITYGNDETYLLSTDRTKSRKMNRNSTSVETIYREHDEKSSEGKESFDVKEKSELCIKQPITVNAISLSSEPCKIGSKNQLLNTFMRDEERPFPCTVCDMKFKLSSHLKNHMYLHSNKTFSCSFCSRTFRQKYPWQQHVENLHHFPKPHNVYPFKCAICPRSFKSRFILQSHQKLKNHVFIVGKPGSKTSFTCTSCSISFSTANHLDRHCKTSQRHLRKVKLSYDKLSSFSCFKCATTFSNRHNYNRHLRSITHLKHAVTPAASLDEDLSATLTCATCSMRFTTKDHLARHSKTYKHRNNQAIVNCNLCSQSFASEGNLRRHCKYNQVHRERLRSKLGLLDDDKVNVLSHE